MPQKEYYTLEEISGLLKKSRATIYNRMKLVGVDGHKFEGDRKTYLTHEEMQKVKSVFDRPWIAPEKQPQA